jgi:hypothetical protein
MNVHIRRRHRATLTTDLFGEWVSVIELTRPGRPLRPNLTMTVTERRQGQITIKELHALTTADATRGCARR